jgi:dihydrofolate reductase
MKNSKIYVIVAVEKNNGIGKDGVMPWSFTKEIQHFHKVTTTLKDPAKQNAVVMGKTTWESLPKKFRPLKNRKNIVLTWENDPSIEAEQKHSIEEALNALKEDPNIENIFMIGGASIYKQSVETLDLDGIYITRIDKDYDCDTFFPEIPEKYSKITKLGQSEEDGVKFEFFLYKK